MKRLTFLIGLFLLLSTFYAENLIAASTEMDTIKPIPEKRRPNLPEPEPEDNALYQVIEEMPRFPGCENLEGKGNKAVCAQRKLREYIAENLKYPQEADEKGIEGTVVVSFVIEKNGVISESKIIRGIGSGCDEEVTRLIKAMPIWIPGRQKGELRRVQYNLPIDFRLAYNENPEAKPYLTDCAELKTEEERLVCTQKNLTQIIIDRMIFPVSFLEKKMKEQAIFDIYITSEGRFKYMKLVKKTNNKDLNFILQSYTSYQVKASAPLFIPAMSNNEQEGAILKFALNLDNSSLTAPCHHLYQNQPNLTSKAIKDEVALLFNYPEYELKNKVEGKVKIEVTVDAHGNISDKKITQGLGTNCDEEARRIIDNLKPLIPATLNDKPIATRFEIEIDFDLKQWKKIKKAQNKVAKQNN